MHLDTDTGGGREKIRVLACSKSHLMRTALQNLLNSENDIMVVGAVTCEANSLHQSIRSQQPDILLFDVSINVEPVEVVKDSLASNEGGLRIVLLGTYDTEDMMIKSLLKGARGALRHDDEYFSIADAIRYWRHRCHGDCWKSCSIRGPNRLCCRGLPLLSVAVNSRCSS
jgi:DNA-binding NarL/FixJ family response regulator